MANVRSLNRVILVGRVGMEPEISHIPSIGRDVAKFSLATNEGYMDKNNEWKETTEWHNLVGWGPVVQKIQRVVNKGVLLLVEGKLKTRRWKDQNDQNRSKTEIEIANLVVLEKSTKGSSYQNEGFQDGGYATKGQNNADLNNTEAQAPLPEKDINDSEYPYDDGSDPF